MRSYPRNSPRAAVRIVALTLLADGHLAGSELAALQRLAKVDRFGLGEDEASAILRDTVLDLLTAGGSAWSGSAHLEGEMLEGVLGEIDDPALRLDVLALCRAAAWADRHVSDGEKSFLGLLERHWTVAAEASA